MTLKTLLIVCNTPSENTKRLAKATLAGATDDAIEEVDVILKQPLDANADDVLSASGIVIGTTENFGYMSGLMKDFLERIYYPCLEHTEGLPYALYVKAGNDGEGAKLSVERIVTGLRWKPVMPATILSGDYQDKFSDTCFELGMTISAGIEAGIY